MADGVPTINEKLEAIQLSEKSPKQHGINAEDLPSSAVPEGERFILMRNGIPVHPQPTNDALDPLNWTTSKKNSILAIVMSLYFMFTYITTTTVPTFPAIQEQYGLSISQVNWTVAIPALGLAVGPLVWSSPADIFGRRIVFIVGTIMAFSATIGTAKASSYDGYMAARFFQGLGCAPASTVGLAIINDIFFEDQRGLRIGLWVLAIDMGLLVGPLVGGFIQLVDHYWVNWLTAILFAVILIAEIAFLPETLYPRNMMLIRMPYSEDSAVIDVEKAGRRPDIEANNTDVIERTTKLPFINIVPVPGMRHPLPWASIVRFILTFKYLAVAVSIMVYSFGCYWWILCVITYIPVAYIQYKPEIQGLLFLGLILGTLFSETFCSGRLSDWLVLKLAIKNDGLKMAEMRLWLIYPAFLLTSLGLIIWGISIDKGYHWMVGQVAFFLQGAGIQMGNAVVAAYVVDCYPLQSMSVIAFYSVILNLSAFISPFFIMPWIEASGPTWCFAAQGIITFFFCTPVFVALHYYGSTLRSKTGAPSWINPEYDTLI